MNAIAKDIVADTSAPHVLTAINAVMAELAQRVHGEFARLNFPEAR